MKFKSYVLQSVVYGHRAGIVYSSSTSIARFVLVVVKRIVNGLAEGTCMTLPVNLIVAEVEQPLGNEEIHVVVNQALRTFSK